MYIPLFVGLVCAIAFYRAAEYERMSPALWAVASLGLSIAVTFISGSILYILIAQAVLFGVMWWYNANRRPDQGS